MRLLVPLLLLAAASAGAQPIPIRALGAAEAVSRDTLGYLYGVRELADGRVLVNDAARRRLLLLDRSLATARVAAGDSGAAMAYGERPTGIIPYRGDSTLFVDQAARALLLLDGSGAVVRVMSPPRMPDVGYLWNPSLGTPGLDATGGLIYRSWLLPAFTTPVVGKPYDPPQLPDSAPLLRGDFDRRVADTLAWIRIPKRGRVVTPLPNGGVRLSATVNPMSTIDDWTVLPDGAIAILRGQDYHLDWIGVDGTRRSSPKLPFDWRRLDDADKRAIVDSTRRAIERMAAVASAAPSAGSAMGLAAAAGGMMNHSMTIMPVGASVGAPPTRAPVPEKPTLPEVVAPSELPDYVPPVMRSGTMRADRAGNVWILPSTSAQAGDGLLYDVVNASGALFQRVRLPAGRALEGFGADGAVYLTSHGPGGTRLERARLGAAAVAEPIVGTWEGSFVSAQGKGGLELVVARDTAGRGALKATLQLVVDHPFPPLALRDFKVDGKDVTWTNDLMGSPCRAAATLDGAALKGKLTCDAGLALTFDATRRP